MTAVLVRTQRSSSNGEKGGGGDNQHPAKQIYTAREPAYITSRSNFYRSVIELCITWIPCIFIKTGTPISDVVKIEKVSLFVGCSMNSNCGNVRSFKLQIYAM